MLWRSAAQFAAAVVLSVALYWLAVRGTVSHIGGDTTAYEAVARDQLGWSTLFSTQRPPLYPLLIRLFGFSRPMLAAFQSLVWAAAWVFFAAVYWRQNIVLLGFALYVALYPGFAAWNHVLMTESLEVSFTAIAFGFLLLFLDGRRMALWGFILVMTFKCSLRGFDTLIDLSLIPLIAGFAAFRRTSWFTAATATVVFLGCFLYLNRATGTRADDVWYFALLDTIGVRVLPNPPMLAFFAAHGMPVNEALRSMTGRWAYEENWRFWTDPDLAGFRQWLTAHGRGVLAAYLFAHPGRTLYLFWQNLGEVFQGDRFRLGYYFDPAYRFDIPIWPPYWTVYAAGSAGTLALTAGLAVRRLSAAAVVPAATAIWLWLSLAPIALAAFYGDPMAIDRHCLPVLLQAALSVLLMVRIGVSAAAGRQSSSRQGQVSEQHGHP